MGNRLFNTHHEWFNITFWHLRYHSRCRSNHSGQININDFSFFIHIKVLGVPEVPVARRHLYFPRAVIPVHTFGGILTVVFLQNTIKVRCMLNH